MAESYRIFGAEMSPYSVKVRSYFRYKGIPHQWILRNACLDKISGKKRGRRPWRNLPTRLLSLSAPARV